MATATAKKPTTAKKNTSKKDDFEIKDRFYRLKSEKFPISWRMKSRNIMWFDEEIGEEREIMVTSNMPTPFVDEFKGKPRLEHIVFRDGFLHVPKNKRVLQKILSLYHPSLNKHYYEVNENEEAVDQIAQIDLEYEALKMANELEFDEIEAVVWTKVGGKVDDMTTDMIYRDAKVMAKNNPELFIEVAQSSMTLPMRHADMALSRGIIRLTSDKRAVLWSDDNQKIVDVPFGDKPQAVLADHFLSDKGEPVYEAILKQLKK